MIVKDFSKRMLSDRDYRSLSFLQ